jgi:hypothetical protein
VKDVPSAPTSIDITGCSNGQSGHVSLLAANSFPPRPVGCPEAFGGAAGNDYADTTPILVGINPSFEIRWADGPNCYRVAAVKAGPADTQWRVRLAIIRQFWPRDGRDQPVPARVW